MMTRREWLNRVVGAVAAAAVAPLVDLTDMTPAFWQQPALKGLLPWRITFPDGLTFSFDAVVTAEHEHPDGTVSVTLRPAGPGLLEREFRHVDPPVGDTETFEPVAPVSEHGTLIRRDGVCIGELQDITPPSLQRADFDGVLGQRADGVLGTLKREGMTFTLQFKGGL